MSEENALTEVTAPVSEAVPDAGVTATPAESPVVGEEVTKGDGKPEATEAAKDEKPAKTFTQEELDRIVAKEKAKAGRKAEKDLQRDIDARVEAALARNKPPEQAVEAPKPARDKFQTDEEWVEAVADWKYEQRKQADQKVSEQTRREEQQRQWKQAVEQTFAEREDQARDKYEDYDDVTRNPSAPITQPMADAIALMDKGPDVAYYLGTHIEDAKRIAKLHPLKQAQELGRIEDKLASAPPPPKPTSAPEPITPVGRPSASAAHVDTLDPRSLAKMGTSAWIEAERKRQTEKWKRAQG